MGEKLSGDIGDGTLRNRHRMLENKNEPGIEGHGHQQIVVPWTVKDALLGVAVVAGATLFTVVLFSWRQGGSESPNSGALTTLALGLMSVILIVSPWVFGIKRCRVRWRTLGFVQAKTRWCMLLPWPVLLLSLTFGGVYVAVITAAEIESLLPPDIPAGALGEGFYRFANIFIIGIAGPLAEEVFFRGFLLAALVRPLGTFRAAAAASAIFAAQHGSLAIMMPIFVSGMLLSWLYLKTRSIWPPFTAHAAQNLIAVSLAS